MLSTSDSNARARQVWSFDDCEVDVAAWRVSKGGRRLAIEPKGVALLALLLERGGDVVAKSEILEEIWKDATVTENAMVRVIGHLRTALGDDAKEPRYIETVHSRGYRFLAPVTRRAVSSSEDTPAAAPTPFRSRAGGGDGGSGGILEPEAYASDDSSSSVPTPFPWRSRHFVIGGLAAAAMLLTLLAIRSRDRNEVEAAAVDAVATFDATLLPPKPSLAVLPLENLGPPERQYFAGGMTDALTTQLGKIGGLLVISRSAVRQYRDERPAPSVIAGELGVRYLVEGSALLTEERVRISAYLVEGASGRQLWAEEYEGALADVLALQSRVAREIAREVRARVTPAEADRLAIAPVVDPAAYEEYLWGLYHIDRVRAVEEEVLPSIHLAIERLERAVALQPSWGEAHGLLAFAFGLLRTYSDDHATRLQAQRRAREVAERALALDPTVATAHRELAGALFLVDGDWQGAEREYREALRLDPNDVGMGHGDWGYSYFLRLAGRFDESLALWRAAQQRWPTTPLLPYMSGITQVCGGRLDQAEQDLSQLRARFATDVHTPLLEAHILGGRGRYAEAADLLEGHRAALMVNRATTYLRELAYDAAKAGQPERARRAIAELRSVGDQDPPWVLFALGDLDAATREIEDRHRRNDYSLRMALCWPGYEEMLQHAEIGRILREVGPPRMR